MQELTYDFILTTIRRINNDEFAGQGKFQKDELIADLLFSVYKKRSATIDIHPSKDITPQKSSSVSSEVFPISPKASPLQSSSSDLTVRR